MRKILFFLTYTSLAFGNRIIGGEVARTGQHEFLAAIYKTTSDGTYFCSGAIITHRWILTAGQCVDNAVSFTIYLGTNNIKTLSSTAVTVATEEHFLHPQFNPLTLENDVGLIKLRMDITFSDNIRQVAMPWFNLEGNVRARVIGWGQTSDDTAQLSDELHLVELATITNQECKIYFGDQITDSMVCLVGNYNEGTCHGDTGSPLVYLYRSSPLHVGIASFVSGQGCESTDPSGFTRTHSVLSWIYNTTGIM